MTAFTIHALPGDVLARVRGTGLDVSGNPVERLTAGSGEPLRCCLRNATAGEELILFGFEPATAAGPYREIGPVFAHARPCPGYTDPHAYPKEWYGRPQVLRAYDRRGWIHDATRTHDGSDPESAVAEILAAPGVVQVHSRNIAYGCYMFAITAD
ncbi:MAG TPA: DUF1203 domain-containing protein [Rugosimonospora sp.]|nr:DUF1203 domain-containing protein [Rugosimonospora sp.]